MDHTTKCVQCGKEFTVTDGEAEFYRSKGLSIPKRCKECRELNKKGKKIKEEDNRTDHQGSYVKVSQRKQEAAKGKPFFLVIMTVIAAFLLTKVTGIDILPTDTPVSEIFTVADNEIPSGDDLPASVYHFRKDDYLTEHFEKHGIEMGFSSAEEYESAANAVINDPRSLTKREKEDNDYVYYLEETNEFVIVSTDGYIRTYFKPDRGKEYFERQ